MKDVSDLKALIERFRPKGMALPVVIVTFFRVASKGNAFSSL
jgi:hypothetical protein